jgi:methionyl-tRNA formyltransferase
MRLPSTSEETAEPAGEPSLRFAFAGDRDIAVRVLDHLLACGARPLALLVSDPGRASHAEELISRCAHLDPAMVFRGREFREAGCISALRELDLDLILAIHFPYLVPEEVLEIPRIGILNLHPAYLPYNRGWHTPSWAILEETPIGATLHFMDRGVDSGDIVHQQRLAVTPGDTANTLYTRLKDLEFEVFREAWPLLASGKHSRTAQPPDAGTSHRRADLFDPAVQRIDPDETVRAEELLRRLRALTTNRTDEAAYYEMNGTRYRIQVTIHEEPAEGTAGEDASGAGGGH